MNVIRIKLDLFKSATFYSIILLVFNVLLPKGGIKLGGIPLTNGYILLFLFSSIAFIVFSFYAKLIKLKKHNFYIIICTLPFLLISTAKILISGYTSLGFVISFYVSFFFMPIAFLFIFLYFEILMFEISQNFSEIFTISFSHFFQFSNFFEKILISLFV